MVFFLYVLALAEVIARGKGCGGAELNSKKASKITSLAFFYNRGLRDLVRSGCQIFTQRPSSQKEMASRPQADYGQKV